MRDISSSGFFAGMGLADVEAISRAGVERRFRRRQVLIRSEWPATHLLLLQTGHVDFTATDRSGRRFILKRLTPGDPIGIACMLSDPVGYLASAEAIDDVQVLSWNHATVQRLVKAYPRWMENSLRIALRYLAEYCQRHMMTVSDTARTRAGYALLDLGKRTGKATPAGADVWVKNDDLAALSDVSRYTLSRVVRQWEEERLVEKHRGGILIRCPERLISACDYGSEQAAS